MTNAWLVNLNTYPNQTISIQKDQVWIGRGFDNDIVLPDPTISLVHARLFYQAGAYIIINVAAGNFVLVNDISITTPVQLVRDSVITLGQTRLKFFTI